MYSTVNIPPTQRIEVAEVKKAVKALLRHCRVEQTDKKQMNSVYFDLQIALINIPRESKTKPLLIHLPHPFLTLEEANICIFTPDTQEKYQKIVQDEVPSATVIALKHLKSKYKPASVKKKLCNEFDCFLAPNSMLATLAPFLGKPFFDRKKQPAGIILEKGTILETVERAVESTRVMIGTGPCLNVHIAKVDQSTREIEENIMKGMNKIATVLKGWENIRMVHIKTDYSISLPLYSSTEFSDSDSDSEF